MTPSDEAVVQRGIRGVLEATGNALTEDEARFYSETVLDAAFPSGEQPGGEQGEWIILLGPGDSVCGAYRPIRGVKPQRGYREVRVVEVTSELPSGGYQRAVSEQAIEAAMAKLRASGNVNPDARAWNTRLTAEAMLAAAAHADEEEE